MNNENELTAALATIEKCRGIVGCPAGVDLQDHLWQLAAENVGLKSSRAILAENALESCNSIACAGFRNEAIMRGLYASTGNGNKYQKPITTLVDEVMRKLETPATDAYLAGIKADALPANIAEIIDSGDLETICYESERSYAEDFRLALYNFRQLREGADK